MPTTEAQGIVQGSDGRYVMSRFAKEGGRWRHVATSRWDMRSVVHRLLLFSRGVTFGISSRWRPAEAQACPADFVEATDSVWHRPCTTVAEHQIHSSRLQNNLIGVVPDDAYLATVPAELSNDAPESYVTVHLDGTHWNIGITLQRRLHACFRFAPGTSEALTGHLGRVQRYWHLARPQTPFPRRCYCLSPRESAPPECFEGEFECVEAVQRFGADALRASGAALLNDASTVPTYSGPTPAAGFRRTRAALMRFSVALFILGPLVAMVPAGLAAWYGAKQARSKERYAQVMAGNREVRALMGETNDLARRVLRYQNTLTRQTNWGLFLDALGRDRPKSLYLERIGTQPVGTANRAVRIALAGWTSEANDVTELIGHLQKLPYISEVNLTSMERDKKKNSLSLFRIVCTLALSEG